MSTTEAGDISSGSSYSSSFDPRLQLLNYTSIEGELSVPFEEFDAYMWSQVKDAIIFGSSIGAAGVAMIVLFLISHKKKSPVFLLNQLCLVATILRCAFSLHYYLTTYSSITFQFTGFTSLLDQQDLNDYAAANFFSFFLVACIEASMVFQVYTIFQNPNGNKWIGRSIIGVSLLTGIATSVLYFYNFVKSVIVVFNDPSDVYYSGALNAQPILFASSINLMTVLLVGKLIMAIRSRRYLGLKQFDGFHILLIMSTQSMIIPSVLIIVSYAVDSLSDLNFTQVCSIIIVLSLPLSSMWAGSANNAPSPTSSGYHVYTPSGKGSSSYSVPVTATTLKGDVESKADQFNDADKNLYTPSTAAEEEAKRYWFGADDEEADDSQFISKTTHHLRTGSPSESL